LGREWAETTIQVRAAILFGSRAKGTSRPDSDVDLALEFELPDELVEEASSPSMTFGTPSFSGSLV
jgi:predicted nucleotidyltransferase